MKQRFIVPEDRFVQVACEIHDRPTPSEIRVKELLKLIGDQLSDQFDHDTVSLYHSIYGEPGEGQ